MDTVLTPQEENDKKKGWFTSIAIHIGIVILLLIPFFTYQDPPPGQEGIVVNLGLPDVGQGDENAGPATPSQPVEDTSEPEEEEQEPVEEPTPPEPEPEQPVVEQPTVKEVVTAEDPEQIALKKKEEEARKKAAEEAAKRKAAEEAKRKAAQEAERKRKEEQARKEAEADAFKDKIGGLFGDGGGKGNTGKPGNQGAENGDPNASNLEGVSAGIGKIQGGLGGRGIVSVPKLADDSQDAGKVSVRVCVDTNGKVVNAEITQKGTTATSARLRNKALQHARTIKFKSGPESKLCGIVPYTFKVK